jgi:hypothetical protein
VSSPPFFEFYGLLYVPSASRRPLRRSVKLAATVLNLDQQLFPDSFGGGGSGGGDDEADCDGAAEGDDDAAIERAAASKRKNNDDIWVKVMKIRQLKFRNTERPMYLGAYCTVCNLSLVVICPHVAHLMNE